MIMFIYTIVFNIVQGNFVTPLVYGKAVSLHPAIILLAVPIGSALAGIVGMFLVVPVAGVIATTWRAVLQTIDTGRAIEPVPPVAAEAGDEIGPALPGAVDRGIAMDADRPKPRSLARVISPRELRLLFWLDRHRPRRGHRRPEFRDRRDAVRARPSSCSSPGSWPMSSSRRSPG